MGNLNLKPPYSKPIVGFLSLGLLLIICSFNNPESKISSENLFSSAKTVISGMQEEIPAVNPEAVALLSESLSHLSNLKQFSVEAQSTFEDLLESGHRVDFEISAYLIVDKPNKLRVQRHGATFNQIFYFNGEVLTLYNPSDKVYATEAVPGGTLEDMFHFARDTYGISAPVSDLLYSNAYDLLMYEVDYAVIIGQELIDNVLCHHLLFSRPEVDFQIWIPVEDSPLPVKYIVTDTETPELLSFTTVMKNWNTTPILSDELFNFLQPKEVTKISFLKAE